MAISRTVSATTRMCFTVITIDNNVTNVVRNFTVTLRFTPFGISRTFITDTPSITITIEDDDEGKNKTIFALTIAFEYMLYSISISLSI